MRWRSSSMASPFVSKAGIIPCVKKYTYSELRLRAPGGFSDKARTSNIAQQHLGVQPLNKNAIVVLVVGDKKFPGPSDDSFACTDRGGGKYTAQGRARVGTCGKFQPRVDEASVMPYPFEELFRVIVGGEPVRDCVGDGVVAVGDGVA